MKDKKLKPIVKTKTVKVKVYYCPFCGSEMEEGLFIVPDNSYKRVCTNGKCGFSIEIEETDEE